MFSAGSPTRSGTSVPRSDRFGWNPSVSTWARSAYSSSSSSRPVCTSSGRTESANPSVNRARSSARSRPS